MRYIQNFFEHSNENKWLDKYARYIKKVRELHPYNKNFAHNFV